MRFTTGSKLTDDGNYKMWAIALDDDGIHLHRIFTNPETGEGLVYYKSDHLDVANQCQDRDLLVQQKRRKGYVLSHGTIGFTIKEGQLVTR